MPDEISRRTMDLLRSGKPIATPAPQEERECVVEHPFTQQFFAKAAQPIPREKRLEDALRKYKDVRDGYGEYSANTALER